MRDMIDTMITIEMSDEMHAQMEGMRGMMDMMMSGICMMNANPTAEATESMNMGSD